MNISSMSKSPGEGGEGPAISFTRLYGTKTSGSYTFHLNGLIELDYTDNSYISSYKSIKYKSGWTTFGQKFTFNAEGHIYHPNLMKYMANISFGHDDTKYGEDAVNKSNSKYITYSFSTLFLRYQPVALALNASRTYSNSEASSVPYDAVSNSYNVILFSRLRWLPVMSIEYAHWDYTSDQMTSKKFYDEWEDETVTLVTKLKTKTTNDMININMLGYLNSLRTRYVFSVGSYRVSSPTRSYENLFVRSRTNSLLGKDNSIWTSFQYAKLDTSKLINLSAEYKPPPLKKNIYHNYTVDYMSSESTDEKSDEKSDSYSFSGIWRYRLSKSIYARADLRLKYGSTAGEDKYSCKIDTSIHYGKPVIKFFNFDSQYNFSMGQESNVNANEYKFIRNGLDMLMKTNKFKWGNIYAGFNIFYNIYDFSIHATNNGSSDADKIIVSQQRLRIGAKVKGPWKALWFIELEARYFDTSSENEMHAWSSLWSGDTIGAKKIRHYSATGDLRFPFLRTGRALFAGSYTTGQTNSQDIQKYEYNAILRYNISRGLSISALWREEWRSKGWWNSDLFNNTNTELNTPSKTRDYEFDLFYTWRKMRFTLEYASTKLDQGFTVSESKRFNFRVRRTF